ncbi:hypothetical protein HY484_04005 [Candidatus Woesearchaeota archaeon]|nr:hypothetical protein [Candidatus Woesearchaeota archaeon]
MELLVKRDPVILERCVGKAHVNTTVADELKHPYVIPQIEVTCPPVYASLADRLMTPDYADAFELNAMDNNQIEAVWSGYRCAIVRGSNGKLYRLKGVAFNFENPDFETTDNGLVLFGGQPKYAVEFEQEMSDLFNQHLRKYGITPVMECKGYWEYPVKKKEFVAAASVIEVKGDTRLDEYMAVIESAFERAVIPAKPNKKGLLVAKRIGQLYYDIGFVVGQLKRIMVKHEQTWGTDKGPSNAHTGNVVLCQDNYNVRIGLVDWDASCTTADFPSEKLAEMQLQEADIFMKTIVYDTQSLRKNAHCTFGYSTFDEPEYPIFCLRWKVRDGFIKGGLSRKIRDSTIKGIPAERFAEITDLIQNTQLHEDCGEVKIFPVTQERVVDFGVNICMAIMPRKTKATAVQQQ